jgi:hypothetical protein
MKMKRTPKFWQGHVDAAKHEAIPTSDYARLHDVPVKSLYRWQLKARPAVTLEANSPSAFVAVRLAETVLPRAIPSCSLMLGSSMRPDMAALPRSGENG